MLAGGSDKSTRIDNELVLFLDERIDMYAYMFTDERTKNNNWLNCLSHQQ